MKTSAADKLWRWAPPLLFAATVALVWPTRVRLPITWDNIDFTLALHHYDVTLHQPHPPGYFLFVMAGRLLQPLFTDPFGALVALAVLGAGLAVVIVYLAGSALFDRRVGLIAGLLMMTSPLAFFYSSDGEAYIFAALFAALVGMLSWRMLTDPKFPWWPSALTLAVAAGFRQTDAAFLLPVWLYAMHGRRGREIAGAVALLAVLVLAWFLPMTQMSGGVAGYLGASRLLSHNWVAVNSPWHLGEAGVRYNLDRLFDCLTDAGAGAALLGMALALATLWYRRVRPGRRGVFFGLWLLPALLFLVFVHFGQRGYAIVLLPPLFLMGAAAVARLGGLARARWLLPVVLTALLLGINLYGLYSRTVPLIRGLEMVGRALEGTDRELQGSAVPGQTVNLCPMILPFSHARGASDPNVFRHVMYFIPDCWTIYFPPDRTEWRGNFWNAGYRRETYRLPAPIRLSGVGRLLVWGRNPLSYLPAGSKPHDLEVPLNLHCYEVRINPRKPLVIGPGYNLQFTPAGR